MITKSKEAMKRLSILVVLALPAMLETMADNKKWTLRECEDYAISNSISIKQSEVERVKQTYTLSTARNKRLPRSPAEAEADRRSSAHRQDRAGQLLRRKELPRPFHL